MSVETVVEGMGTDVKSFFLKLSSDVAKAKAVWAIISSQTTRAAIILVTRDVIAAAVDAYDASKALGANVTLDSATVTAVEALVADFKAGDAVIAADMKAIGVVLNPPSA